MLRTALRMLFTEYLRVKQKANFQIGVDSRLRLNPGLNLGMDKLVSLSRVLYRSISGNDSTYI